MILFNNSNNNNNKTLIKYLKNKFNNYIDLNL